MISLLTLIRNKGGVCKITVSVFHNLFIKFHNFTYLDLLGAHMTTTDTAHIVSNQSEVLLLLESQVLFFLLPLLECERRSHLDFNSLMSSNLLKYVVSKSCNLQVVTTYIYYRQRKFHCSAKQLLSTLVYTELKVTFYINFKCHLDEY